jgi:hypothetical protein
MGEAIRRFGFVQRLLLGIAHGPDMNAIAAFRHRFTLRQTRRTASA